MKLSDLNWKEIHKRILGGNPELANAVRVVHGFDLSDASDRADWHIHRKSFTGNPLSSAQAGLYKKEALDEAKSVHSNLASKAMRILEAV